MLFRSATSANNYAGFMANSANGYATTYAQSVGASANNYAATNYATQGQYSSALGVAQGAFARANSSATSANPTFTGTINMASAAILAQTLSDASTIAWDASQGTIAYVTLGGNRTLANPANLKVGTYILHVLQDGSGSRTLSYGSAYKWPAGVAPVLTTSAGRRDILSFVCDGTYLYGSFLPDVR